jgi:CHASE3 domain sensor protein
LSLKGRVFFSFSFSILLAVGLGAALLFGLYQGQGLFESITRSFQVRQAVRETDYLLHRHNQVLLYYVMFHDDADRMYIDQFQDSLHDRLDTWEKLVDQGWGTEADLAEVKIKCQRLFFLRSQILRLVERGRQVQAIEKVRKDYVPATSQAEEAIRLAARHLDNDSHGMTGELASVIKRSRTLFKVGSLFSLLLFVVFVWDIRRAMVLPAMTSRQVRTGRRPR